MAFGEVTGFPQSISHSPAASLPGTVRISPDQRAYSPGELTPARAALPGSWSPQVPRSFPAGGLSRENPAPATRSVLLRAPDGLAALHRLHLLPLDASGQGARQLSLPAPASRAWQRAPLGREGAVSVCPGRTGRLAALSSVTPMLGLGDDVAWETGWWTCDGRTPHGCAQLHAIHRDQGLAQAHVKAWSSVRTHRQGHLSTMLTLGKKTPTLTLGRKTPTLRKVNEERAQGRRKKQDQNQVS